MHGHGRSEDIAINHILAWLRLHGATADITIEHTEITKITNAGIERQPLTTSEMNTARRRIRAGTLFGRAPFQQSRCYVVVRRETEQETLFFH